MFPLKFRSKFRIVFGTALCLLFFAQASVATAQWPLYNNPYNVELWPDGVVEYTYGRIDPDQRQTIEGQIHTLTETLRLPDPADPNRRVRYIQFILCDDGPGTPACPANKLVIRNNVAEEDNDPDKPKNTCRYDPQEPHIKGRNPAGNTLLRVERSTGPNTIMHELLHCLGVWHEFNRTDADSWLTESAGYDFMPRQTTSVPLLGNFDYDSVMLYQSYCLTCDPPWNYRDRVSEDLEKTNAFSRFQLPVGQVPSQRDISRILQMYAWERQHNWGFFFSISEPPANSDDLPNPYLANGASAVGSPAISYFENGSLDMFARGSDGYIHWKSLRRREGDSSIPAVGVTNYGWMPLGCCFASDPAVVAQGNDRIDLVAVEQSTGQLKRLRYDRGRWGDWSTVNDGYPPGGLKPASTFALPDAPGGFGNPGPAIPTEYIGPALASRAVDSLDVFVVRSDGRLALTTLNNGEWTKWLTLGDGYNVTARPAAIALSATQVQLAINESDYNLYEPLLRSDALPFFSLGDLKATTAYRTPPALTKRDDADNPYRVLITNPQGRISHRFANGSWRDIGGISKEGTGPTAVATGRFSALILMNGEDQKGCEYSCIPADSPSPNVVIQPGGLWLRSFQ